MEVNFECNKGVYIVYIKPIKMLKIKINNKQYSLKLPILYYFICETEGNINVVLEDLFGGTIKDKNDIVENINIFEYGHPVKVNKLKYQVLYSFDSNYYHGAFTSIYSLLCNFNKNNLKELNVNLCVPEDDFESVTKELLKFIRISKYDISYTLMLSTMSVVNKVFLDTTCYKGGNHLLKLSNFSRLIAGKLLDSEKLLYIDSDTIVQTDMSKCLDKITDTDYVILGKKSHLNYINLININNVQHALAYLGRQFDLTKNVIYTGTIIINTKNFRQYYSKIIELVYRHNSVKNGIYKLFTMSIINLAINSKIKFSDDYIRNVVDLGFKSNLEDDIKKADVLDWSGMFKPWFKNGLYKEYWLKYNIMYDKYPDDVMYKKDTTETFT